LGLQKELLCLDTLRGCNLLTHGLLPLKNAHLPRKINTTHLHTHRNVKLYFCKKITLQKRSCSKFRITWGILYIKIDIFCVERRYVDRFITNTYTYRFITIQFKQIQIHISTMCVSECMEKMFQWVCCRFGVFSHQNFIFFS